MLRGASQAQLINCLGIYKGSKYGGYQALYAAMVAEQEQSSAAVRNAAGGAVGAAEATQRRVHCSLCIR